MMSLRTIARSAPRTLTRFSTTALKQSRVARPSAVLKSTWTPLRPQFATFSTTQFRKAPAGEVDEELSVKLESELQFEEEMKENDGLPANIKDFLENSSFEIIDEPGKEDVILKRQYGNETVTVSFSISDLASLEQDMFNEDAALSDEDLAGPPSGANRDAAAAEDSEFAEDEEDMSDAAVPCRLNVVVEKEGRPGALNIEAVAHNGHIEVENFYYFKDAKLAHSGSAETAHKAQDTYPGPPFGSLDEDLQILMERYLEERGVTQALAVFVPDYMDMKEQKEYQAWLKDVKDFVDA